MKIGIVGMGNIGASLYRALDTIGYQPEGVDINASLVEELRAEGYRVHQSLAQLIEVDVWVIAISVGADFASLLQLMLELSLQPGALVSVESTLMPGTCQVLASVLEQRGKLVGEDVFLIHAPHRILFGYDTSPLAMTRVIGGFTTECLDKGMSFYASLGAKLFPVSDIRAAELSKVVENSVRYVEIAFAEEIRRYCDETGLSFPELRAAVNTKGNVDLKEARLGIGGECLPKDMDFLFRSHPAPLFAGAQGSEQAYREWLFQRCLKAECILVKGISYKPGLKDVRFSPGLDLITRLQKRGKKIYVEDNLFTDEELKELGLQTQPEGHEPDLVISSF